MPTAVCPGSFDPPTLGHLDVIERAASLFDEVSVAVLVNESKVSLFSVDERMDMLRNALGSRDNVVVTSFSGLLIDFCAEHDIPVVVKGLREPADFGYELQMAQMNAQLTNLDTVFLPTRPEWSYVSSSLVKEVARLGGDVTGLVPSDVLARLSVRLAHQRPVRRAGDG